jgi:hypothetical protein
MTEQYLYLHDAQNNRNARMLCALANAADGIPVVPFPSHGVIEDRVQA